MIKKIIIAVLVNVLAFGGIIHHAHAEFHQLQKRKSLECLAMNIYFETKASSLADAMAVSDVVMNRVYSRHFPNNICDVIYQAVKHQDGTPKRNQCQFSWYCDGKSDEPKNKTAWEKSRKYASDFYIYSKYIGITEGATHYHATYVKPYWAPTLDRITRIGSHIFYRLKGG